MKKLSDGSNERIRVKMTSKRIILASNSPRRRELLSGLNIDFDVMVLPGIDEDYPDSLSPKEIVEYIAGEKAVAYTEFLQNDTVILTADTIVAVDNEILGKPHNETEARLMLRTISGRTHQVITGVCLMSSAKKKVFSVSTDVTFKILTDQEIDYYIKNYQPFDKAGAYGIQEWIGYIGVTYLKGSYFNVMGLPVQRIYTELQAI